MKKQSSEKEEIVQPTIKDAKPVKRHRHSSASRISDKSNPQRHKNNDSAYAKLQALKRQRVINHRYSLRLLLLVYKVRR